MCKPTMKEPPSQAMKTVKVALVKSLDEDSTYEKSLNEKSIEMIAVEVKVQEVWASKESKSRTQSPMCIFRSPM